MSRRAREGKRGTRAILHVFRRRKRHVHGGTRRREGAAHDRRTLLYKYSPGNSSWGKDETLPAELAPLLSERQRLLFEPPYVAYRRPVT